MMCDAVLEKMFRCLLRNLQDLTENQNAYDDATGERVSFKDCEAMLTHMRTITNEISMEA
jgi:alpha/beta superfamily hydrolase